MEITIFHFQPQVHKNRTGDHKHLTTTSITVDIATPSQTLRKLYSLAGECFCKEKVICIWLLFCIWFCFWYRTIYYFWGLTKKKSSYLFKENCCFIYSLIRHVFFKVLLSTVDTLLPWFFSVSSTHSGMSFVGWCAGPVANFVVSSVIWNWWPFKVDFNFRNKKSLQGQNLESRVAVGWNHLIFFYQSHRWGTMCEQVHCHAAASRSCLSSAQASSFALHPSNDSWQRCLIGVFESKILNFGLV